MKIKFIHTADWQIGKPFAGVEDAEKRGMLSQKRIAAIQRLGEAAQSSDAKFIVVAGDLFDSNSPTKSLVSRTLSAIGKLNLPIYVIPGNHDHGAPGSIWQQNFFLEEKLTHAPNLHILMEASPMELDDVILFPCPLLRKHENRDLTAWLRDESILDSLVSDKPRVVLAHGSVENFGSFVDEEENFVATANTLDLNRLCLEHFDYLALGDWHGYKKINEKSWYSGTPEHDRFPKGVNHQQGKALLVTVEREVLPEVQVLDLSSVHWNKVDFTFRSLDCLTDFQQQLMDLVSNRVDEDLLYLTLEGSLGLKGFEKLDNILDKLKARLIRLKLVHKIQLQPSGEELDGLIKDVENPLIARVAQKLKLKSETSSNGEAEIAIMALKELFFQSKSI